MWFTWLEPGLALSGAPAISAPGLAAFAAIVNVSDVEPPAYAAGLTANTRLIRWPFADSLPAPPAFVRVAVLELAACRQQGVSTLVHCQVGQSRSPTIVALEWMGRRGLTWPAAIAQLRQHRPQVDPHPLLTTPAVRAAIVESVQAFLAGQTEVLTAARSAAAALWTAHHHRPPAPNVPEGAEIEPGLLVGTRATPAANALVLDLYHLRPDTPNDPQTVQSAVDQLRAERRAGRTVLVRCCDGKSLSALVVALALMAERAWDWPTALWYIRQRQPGAWPRPQSLLGLETLIWLR